jgi:hypothetical protein
MAQHSLPRPAGKPRAPKSQSTTRRTAPAPNRPSDLDKGRSMRLINLKDDVLDCLAVVSVTATSLDPDATEVRVLQLAEERLLKVSDALVQIANELGVPRE